MIFTDTVTIYNHFTENGEDRWKRTVLNMCHWNCETLKTVQPDGKVHISDVVSLTILDRQGYAHKKDWIKNREGWTVDPECNKDIVVLGVCEKELSREYRLKDFKREVPNVMTVAGLADNTNRDRLKHWRVIAR